MPLTLENYTFKIIGWRLLLLVMASITLYSMASAYIGGSLTQTIHLLQQEPEIQGNYSMLSIYSGSASTPVTGLIPEKTLDNIRNVTGVIVAWGETTTPVTANNTLAVLRGIPMIAVNYTGLNLTLQSVNQPLTVWIGKGLANKLNLETGDTLVLDSPFTTAQAIVKVAGLVEGPSPYNWEILASPELAQAMRGSRGYTTIRIIYDPTRLDTNRFEEALQAKTGLEKIIVQQAIVLVSKGVVEVRDPSQLESYFLERLGIPGEYIFTSGIASDILLSLLIVPLAWVLIGVRRGSLTVLYSEGVPPWRLKASILLVSLPFTLTGILLGLLLARYLPTTIILGYPLTYNPPLSFQAIHIAALMGLYSVGIASTKLEG